MGKATALAQMGRNDEVAALLRRGPPPRPEEPAGPLQQGQFARAAPALRGGARPASRRPTVWPRGSASSGTTARSASWCSSSPRKAGASLRRYLSLDPPPDALTDQARGLLRGHRHGRAQASGERPGSAEARRPALVRGNEGKGTPSPGEREALDAAAGAPPLLGAGSRAQPPPSARAPASASPPATAPRRRAGPAPAASRAAALGPTVRDLNNEGDAPLPGRALHRRAGQLRARPRARSVRRRGPRQSRECPLQARQDRRSDRGPRARPGLRSLLPPELGQQGGHRADERTPSGGPRLVPRGRGPGGQARGSHGPMHTPRPNGSSRPESRHRRGAPWAGWDAGPDSARPTGSRRPSRPSIERWPRPPISPRPGS